MARELFGFNESVDLKAADLAIDAIEKFYNSIGVKTRLADYEIDAQEAAERVRDRFKARNTHLGEKVLLMRMQHTKF